MNIVWRWHPVAVELVKKIKNPSSCLVAWCAVIHHCLLTVSLTPPPSPWPRLHPLGPTSRHTNGFRIHSVACTGNEVHLSVCPLEIAKPNSSAPCSSGMPAVVSCTPGPLFSQVNGQKKKTKTVVGWHYTKELYGPFLLLLKAVLWYMVLWLFIVCIQSSHLYLHV